MAPHRLHPPAPTRTDPTRRSLPAPMPSAGQRPAPNLATLAQLRSLPAAGLRRPPARG